MRWRMLLERKFWKDFSKQFVQFLITIFFLNSIGVWLPLIPDWWEYSMVTNTTCEGIPFNLMTYFLGIVAVAIYERIKYLLKADHREDKELEYSFWVIIGVAFLILSGLLMKAVKNKQTEDAIMLGLYSILSTYVVWWLVYYKQPKSSLYGALGQEDIE
jgi:undecaprenyl pyrophosphate phosphatase UppP